MPDPQHPSANRPSTRQAMAGLCNDALLDASRAVARFVDERKAPLTIDAPATRSLPALLDVIGSDAPVVVVGFELSGAVTGAFAQIMSGEAAIKLAAILFNRAASMDEAIGPIAELGNIAASAFLNRLAGNLGGACLPSVPRLFAGPTTATVPAVFGNDVADIATVSLRLLDVPVWLATTPRPVAPLRRPY